MLTNADNIQMMFVYVLDGLAILLNAVLVLAIMFRTPKSMRPYSIFLLNNAMVDICSAIASALATIRLVNSHSGQMIFVSLGPCSLISHSFCQLCHCIHLTLATHSVIVLFISFCYRLLIISRTIFIPSTMKIWLVCLISFLPSLLAGYRFVSFGEELPIAMQRQLGIEGYASSRFPHISDMVAPLSYYIFCSPIVMTFIFFVRRRLLAKIALVNVKERNHHGRIAQALTYQMLLPLGLGIGCGLWLADLYELIHGQWGERSIMLAVSVFALLSPIINLFYLPPYRGIFTDTRNQAISIVSSFA